MAEVVVVPGGSHVGAYDRQHLRDAAAVAFALEGADVIGRVDEVNGAVLGLASDEASYVTGSVVTVDGGYTIS